MIMSSKITPGLLALMLTRFRRPVEPFAQIDAAVVAERSESACPVASIERLQKIAIREKYAVFINRHAAMTVAALRRRCPGRGRRSRLRGRSRHRARPRASSEWSRRAMPSTTIGLLCISESLNASCAS